MKASASPSIIYDALGRETNTVTYAGTTSGEATTPAGGARSCASATTTTYPYGGPDYAIHTDERGAQVITSIFNYPEVPENN